MNQFFLRYSDDSKKNTFNIGGNKGHRLKMLRVNRPLYFAFVGKLNQANFVTVSGWMSPR